MWNLRLLGLLLAAFDNSWCESEIKKLPLEMTSGSSVAIKGDYPPIGPGTDSALYNPTLYQGDIYDEDPERNAISDPKRLWPYAAIVYKVDDSIGCPYSPQCEMLMKAMDHFHQRTCVRWKPWNGEDNYVRIFFNKADTGSCWSQVGMVGKEQKVSLSLRCWYFGIVLHELSHSIGMFHEMNRPDRDNYITIYWQNIIPSYVNAFAKYPKSYVKTLGEPFDYSSVMLYDEYAFSKDNISPTVVANDGRIIGPIWRKTKLSDVDVRRIEKLYSCHGSKSQEGFPYDIKCNFDKHICGFQNAGHSVWRWRNDNDGHVFNSFETVGSTIGYLVSTNMHPVKYDDSRGRLGCVRYWYIIQTDGNATLKLNQAYLDKSTTLHYNPTTIFNIWENNSTHVNKWFHVDVPIYTTKSFRLIFESQFTGNNSYGTIAVDDVEIIYGDCSKDKLDNFGRSIDKLTTFSSLKKNESTTIPTFKY